MDSRQWNGEDNRDDLAPDYEAEERCPDCGEHVTECAKDCGCKACRDAELDEQPKDAA